MILKWFCIKPDDLLLTLIQTIVLSHLHGLIFELEERIDSAGSTSYAHFIIIIILFFYLLIINIV